MSVVATPSTPALGGSRWNTFPAAGITMTARDFFTAIEPLLQGIIDDNALTSDSEVLEDQIHRTPTRDAHIDDVPGTADVWTTLRTPGPVWSEAGSVTLNAVGQDELVVLAPLGKFCPENVALRPAEQHLSQTGANDDGASRLSILVDPAQGH